METQLRAVSKTTPVFVLLILALLLSSTAIWAQSGSVTGTVKDSNGDALPGATVSLQNAAGDVVGSPATSDANGAFTIRGVAAGDYTASVDLDGFQTSSQAVSVSGSSAGSVAFTIQPAYHDTVMVTAEKVEEDILDVPMTITAYDSSMLQELVIQDRSDLQNLVPGLQFGDEQEQVGQGTVIRGIGSRLAGETHSDLAVATYVDGAYTLGTYGVSPGGGFDLERVEVARGPQGTLNGRNSIAGAINVVTKGPTNNWDATLMTETTDISQQRYNAAVGGPLSDAFSFRITGGVHTGDGIQENVSGIDYGAPDQTFFSPKIRAQTDRFEMNVRWTHVEDTGTPTSLVQLSNVNRTDARLPASASPDETGTIVNEQFLWETPNPAINPNCPIGQPGYLCGDVNNRVALNFPGFANSESDLITVNMQYQLSDSLNIRYNFSDSDVNQNNTKDADYTDRRGIGENPNTLDHTISTDGGVTGFDNRSYEFPYLYDETSHELLLTSSFSGPFNFIGGLFTYENDTDWSINWRNFAAPFRFGTADDQARNNSPIFGFVPVNNCQDVLTSVIEGFGIGTADPAQAGPFGGTYWFCPEGSEHLFNTFFTKGSSETQAAFFSGTYQVNDSWTVSGGLRYTEDEKVQRAESQGFSVLTQVGSLVGVTTTGTGNPDTQTWSAPIGHLSLEYTTGTGDLIYGRISTGYRAGGFNTQAIGTQPPPIEEETLINYELGAKGFFLSNRLMLASGLWYNDFDGYQLNATQEPPPGTPIAVLSDSPLFEFTTNIDDTKIYGADFEFDYRVGLQFSVRGFYSYQDSELGPHRSVLRGDPNAQFSPFESIDLDTGQVTTSFFPTPTDQTGNKLPMQPENKLALTLAYDQPVGNGNVQLLTTYAFTDKRFADIGNLPIYELPSFDRLDAGITWSPNDRWGLTLFAQNIFDEIGIVEFVPESTNGGNAAIGALTNPREVGLQIRFQPFR